MCESTGMKSEEGKPVQLESSVTAAPAIAPSKLTAAGEVPEQTYKMVELLKHWPVVVIAIQKSRDEFCSVKQKACIITWSLNLSEKVVASVLELAERKLSSLRPITQYADKAVSEGMAEIEKKFPAVKESPEKLYDAITQHVAKMVHPALDKTEAISEIGRKRLDRVAKTIINKYNSLIKIVDSWMDKLENRLNGVEAETASHTETAVAEALSSAARTQTSTTTASPVPAPAAGHVWQALRLGAGATTALAAFQVEAALWLLSRAPLVGRFFREAPPPTADPSPSSSSRDASFARLPTPTASQEQPLPTAQSTDSFHTERFISLPQQ
ncbi:uncharacterized protein LOC126272828 isoform X2 [Schistocerca gregaria]|uniref:uncharacterized protein LOC126272828 isoform X2 n=1 Tax=Schistocerca gregaria TaxID=7010 RepID=UPI00211DC255|nr:uncharacterized protein LOC126272828 isoform X2 [Schistocerca gregaria]XP_049831984.1 uncharacterized protein LOC126272828 isoform X2 [Schistocerca gregaria]